MTASKMQKGLMGLTVLLAAFYVVMGPVVLVFAGSGDWDPSALERAVLGLVPLAAGTMMLGGLFISKRSPWLGGGLLTVGAVAMVGLWFWLFFILVPVTLLVVAFGVLRARRFARERRAVA